MSYNRMKPADRQADILKAAVTVAERLGYNNFRLVDVAAEAQCSTGSVMRYYATMGQVRRAVMGQAIKQAGYDLKKSKVCTTLGIIAVGLALHDPRCRKLPAELRERAIATLS